MKHTPTQLAAWADVQPRALSALRRLGPPGRRPHAIGLSGAPATSLDQVGAAFVCALCCQAPQDPFDACGQCEACLGFSRQNLSNQWTLGGGDKPAGVDEIRSLGSRIALTDRGQGAKVVRILQACRLNAAAQNALLKMLEEPTADTTFVLEIERWAVLLPTVRSRLVRVHLSTPPYRAAYKALTQDGIDAELAGMMAPWVGCNLALARELIEKGLPAVHESLLKTLAVGLPSSETTRMAQSLGSDKDAARRTLPLLEIFVRDALARHLGAKAFVEPEAWARAARLDVPSESLAHAAQRLSVLRRHEVFQPNRTMQLENLLFALNRRDCSL